MLKTSKILLAKETQDLEDDIVGKSPQDLYFKDPGPLTAEQIASGGLLPLMKGVPKEWVFPNLSRWAYKHLRFIGEGSSRSAYKIDEDHALKIAINESGQTQNKVESHIAQKMHDLPITKVHYVSKCGYFLLVDFAHELNYKHFRQTYKISFDDFCEVCRTLTPWERNKRTINRARETWIELPPEVQGLISSLKAHGILLFDVKRDDQWGDFKNKPVIIDYGLNQKTWTKHYS